MSQTYIAEYAETARIALDLAEREVAHLRYTYETLFSEHIDLAWVEKLQQREDLAEK